MTRVELSARSKNFPVRPTASTAPSLDDAVQGRYVRAGQSGASVGELQEMLRARGYAVPAHGHFDRETAAAVRAFQRDNGCQIDGIVGPETVGALRGAASSRYPANDSRPPSLSTDRRAPHLGEPAPPGTVQAQRLVDAARVRQHGTSEVQPAPIGASGADQRLEQLQQRTIGVAEREVGVREDPGGTHRGERVDQYARSAGMAPGGHWCAYFANFAYSETAKENGGQFSGQKKLHSYQKNYAWFSYGSYTKGGAAARSEGAALRDEHAEQGSTRRYMAIAGSRGEKYASAQSLPHEVYTDFAQLPLRTGDTALFQRGHVGLVKSYDPSTGRLVTIEGNPRVKEHVYDLSNPNVFRKFDGFGRPALGDFGQK